MAALVVQKQTARNSALADLTSQAAAASDTFDNDGKTVVIVVNDDATPKTVVATVIKDLGGMVTEAGFAVPVTNAKESWMGPFDVDVFGTTVTLTPSDTTSLTYRVVSLLRRF